MNSLANILTHCQISGSSDLRPIMFLGYVPPVNSMRPIGQRPREETMFPLELLYCPESHLVQISCLVDPAVLFPPEYPYRSGTTRILRENFADLFRQSRDLGLVREGSFVIDIGSNDGTLLSNFKEGGCKVLGIEPTAQAQYAQEHGIDSVMRFFNKETAADVREERGAADLVTAANVFAHMPDPDALVAAIVHMLSDDGVFINESHYLLDLIQTLQYDTVYHEHLRYYSLHAQQYLFARHGLEIFRVQRIPTHGGSIRVFIGKAGARPVDPSVETLLTEEREAGLLDVATYESFARRVMDSKLGLLALIRDIKAKGGRIHGIGAPSRASTLITYTGLDHQMIDCVLEVSGSNKIGKYMPGTLIPVEEEKRLFTEQPEYALLLSWHISTELQRNLRKNGFRGKFIIPLPEPHIVE